MRKNTKSRAACLIILAFLTLFILVPGQEAFAFFGKFRHYSEGLKHFKNNDYDLAKQSFLRALKDDANYTEAKQSLGLVYFRLEMLKEAEDIFLALYKDNNRDPNALLGLAWINFKLGRDDNAKKFFQEEIKWAESHIFSDIYSYYPSADKRYIESVFSDGWFGLSQIAKRNGKYDEALKALGKAMEYSSDFTGRDVFLSNQGEIYFKQSRFDEAARAQERAAREDRKNPAYLVYAGFANRARKDYSAAENAFERALKIDDVNAGALYGLLLVQHEKGDKTIAKQTLSQFIALYPHQADNVTIHNMIADHNWSDLWKNFGAALYESGNYHRAVFMFNSYLTYVNAHDVESLTKAGWSYRMLGNNEAAIHNFRKAAKLAPSADEPVVGIASLQLAAGNFAEAKKLIDDALRQNPRSAAANTLLAHLNLYQKNDDRALNTLKKALAQNEGNLLLAETLAGILFTKKMYAEAAQEYEKITRTRKNRFTTWNNLGWSLYYAGNNKEALRAFTESINKHPYQAEPYYGRFMAYLGMKEPDRAKLELSYALKLHPDYILSQEAASFIKASKDRRDLTLSAAAGYSFRQQSEKALNLYKGHLKEDPGNITATLGAGLALFNLGQGDEALNYFQSALTIDPKNTEALTGWGWVLAGNDKNKEAITYIDRALAIQPELSNSLRAKAWALYRNREFREADELYKRIAATEPYSADAYSNRGWALFRQNKFDDAINNFNTGATLNPSASDAYYGLAFCYAGKGDYAKTKPFLSTAIYMNPSARDGQELYDTIGKLKEPEYFRNALGQSHLIWNNFDRAAFHFQMTLKKDGDNQDAILGLAAVSYKQGKFKEAVDQLEKALKKAPQSADTWDKWSVALESLGWSYFNMKEYEKAFAAFKRLAGYNASQPVTAPLNGLGWCELQKNNKKAAEDYFRQSLAIVPGNIGATSGLAALK